MWFYSDFCPNEDARAFLAFIKRYLFENPHLTEPQKCEALYTHLCSGWEADNWYKELESSAPEVLTSWPTLRNHFHVKWLSTSPSTLLQIPKCKPSIVCTAMSTPCESTINQARRATSESTKREEKGEEEEEERAEEGVKQVENVPGDANDIVVTSQSADCLHSTTTDARPPNSTTTTTTSQTN